MRLTLRTFAWSQLWGEYQRGVARNDLFTIKIYASKGREFFVQLLWKNIFRAEISNRVSLVHAAIFRAHVANRKLKTVNSFWFYFFWLPSLLTIARTVLDCVRDKKHGYFSFENARPFVWVRSPTELRLCVLWLLSIIVFCLFVFVLVCCYSSLKLLFRQNDHEECCTDHTFCIASFSKVSVRLWCAKYIFCRNIISI